MPIGLDTRHQTETDEVGLLDYSMAIHPRHMRRALRGVADKTSTDLRWWSHVYVFINPPTHRKMANLEFAPQATLLPHGDGSVRVVFGIAL